MAYKYLTPEQVARLCGVNRMTIYNWIRRGKLPVQSLGKHYKIRIAEMDIPTFLRKQSVS